VEVIEVEAVEQISGIDNGDQQKQQTWTGERHSQAWTEISTSTKSACPSSQAKAL